MFSVSWDPRPPQKIARALSLPRNACRTAFAVARSPRIACNAQRAGSKSNLKIKKKEPRKLKKQNDRHVERIGWFIFLPIQSARPQKIKTRKRGRPTGANPAAKV